jgi:hypothetical protein
MEMLNWQEENGRYLGFCDGEFLYRVSETSKGWIWETADGWEGECDFETDAQAREAAQKHFNKRLAMEEWLEMNDPNLGYTLEELNEILGDMLCEEHKENELFTN